MMLSLRLGSIIVLKSETQVQSKYIKYKHRINHSFATQVSNLPRDQVNCFFSTKKKKKDLSPADKLIIQLKICVSAGGAIAFPIGDIYISTSSIFVIRYPCIGE